MNNDIIEIGIDDIIINSEKNLYLPLTRKGYTRRKLRLTSQISHQSKSRLKRIDNLSHTEAITVLSRKNIISSESEAPTHLLKNMLVALTI